MIFIHDNIEQHSAMVMDFAKKNGLEAYLDDAKNVIIKKKGTLGFEKAAPVILQGHLDMVGDKLPSLNIDLEKEIGKKMKEIAIERGVNPSLQLTSAPFSINSSISSVLPVPQASFSG